MELEKGRKVHTYLSNVFYYLFVAVTVSIFVFSLILKDFVVISLLLDILSILLIVVSVVITFYLAWQMSRYNINVRKTVQVGVFLIVIGFLLILCSVIKQVSFKGSWLNSILGDNLFVYWGIGAILVGVFFELTFLDQGIWELIKKPFIFLWRSLVKFFRWIKTHWKNILLYTLDIVSLAVIIYVAIVWEIKIWKLITFSVACVYPIIHHHRRIWRAIRFVAVNIFYRLFYEIAMFLKRMFIRIWNALISFFKFIGRHWWIILKEFLRIASIVALCVVFWLYLERVYYAGWVVLFSVVIQLFTRIFILKAIYRALRFVFKKIIEFFVKHWRRIIAEFLRLIFFIVGIVIIVLTAQKFLFLIQSYYYAIGVLIGIISEVFSRKAIWKFIIKYRVASVRVVGLILAVLGVVLEFTIDDYGNWLPLTSTLIAVGAFMVVFARIIIEPIILWNFLKSIGRVIKRVAVAIYNFLKKNWWVFLKEFLRIASIVALCVVFWLYLERIYYAGWVVLFIIVIQLFTRIFILKQITRFLKHVGFLIKRFLLWLSKPLRYLWRAFINLLRFLKEHWLKVLLYTLDIVSIGVIIYFSIQISKIFEWWYVLLIAIGVLYIPIHHYKTVWKTIRFIAVDVFYRFFKTVYNLLKRTIVTIANFIKKYWRATLKEFLRILGAAIGVWFILIKAGAGGIEDFGAVTAHLTWIGVVIIVSSLLLSRRAVLKFIYNLFKRMATTLFRYRVPIFRVFGLAVAIYGLVIGFSRSWSLAAILSVSIGGAFLLFSHWIFHPKKFIEFLKKIPKVIKKILDTIWLVVKTIAVYIFDNFIWLILLLTVLGSAAYGISLLIGVDFLRTAIDDLSHGIKAGIGGGLIMSAIVAFILLQRQFKKLRTGSSRVLAQQIKERWKQ